MSWSKNHRIVTAAPGDLVIARKDENSVLLEFDTVQLSSRTGGKLFHSTRYEPSESDQLDVLCRLTQSQ